MTSLIVDTVNRLVSELGLDHPARILILGDPYGIECAALACTHLDITCDPDGQGPSGVTHHGQRRSTAGSRHRDGLKFDVVIAVAGWRRVQQVRSPAQMEELLAWMTQHGRVLIIESPRTPLAPDLHDLGPYDVVPSVGRLSFVSEIDEQVESFSHSRPVLVASNEGLLLRDRWIPALELALVPTTDAPKPNPVRTFVGSSEVIKIDFACTDYFHQSPALAEADFLESLTDAERVELGFPSITTLQRGRAVSVVCRERLPGEVLEPGAFRNDSQGVKAVINAAARLASHGLFHNDLRPWNLLRDGKHIRFIDFANTARVDADVQRLPQVAALAATLAGIMTEDLEFGEAFSHTARRMLDRCGFGDDWRLARLLHGPWLALPERAASLATALASSPDLDGEGVIRTVLTLSAAGVDPEPTHA